MGNCQLRALFYRFSDIIICDSSSSSTAIPQRSPKNPIVTNFRQLLRDRPSRRIVLSRTELPLGCPFPLHWPGFNKIDSAGSKLVVLAVNRAAVVGAAIAHPCLSVFLLLFRLPHSAFRSSSSSLFIKLQGCSQGRLEKEHCTCRAPRGPIGLTVVVVVVAVGCCSLLLLFFPPSPWCLICPSGPKIISFAEEEEDEERRPQRSPSP